MSKSRASLSWVSILESTVAKHNLRRTRLALETVSWSLPIRRNGFLTGTYHRQRCLCLRRMFSIFLFFTYLTGDIRCLDMTRSSIFSFNGIAAEVPRTLSQAFYLFSRPYLIDLRLLAVLHNVFLPSFSKRCVSSNTSTTSPIAISTGNCPKLFLACSAFSPPIWYKYRAVKECHLLRLDAVVSYHTY